MPKLMKMPRNRTTVPPLTLNPIAPTSYLRTVFDDLPLNGVAGQLAQEGETLDVVVDFERGGTGLLGVYRLHVGEPAHERQQFLLNRLAYPTDVAVVLDGSDRVLGTELGDEELQPLHDHEVRDVAVGEFREVRLP